MLSTRHRMELRSRAKRLLCLVSLPDSTVFEVDFDTQSDGLEIINQVCERLGIIETDYFGLVQQNGKKGERLWLNLRNRVQCELCGSQPYRLEFRVKFFVPPHMIQQDATRHQFYLNICENFIIGKLRPSSNEQTAQLVAAIAQVEFGDVPAASCDSLRQQYLRLLPVESTTQSNDDLLAAIGAEHSRLSGTLESSAKYRVLQLVAELPWYSCCHHEAKTTTGQLIRVAVGSDGIVLYRDNWTEIKSIDYSAIQKLTNDSSCLQMEIVGEDQPTESHILRLASRALASALYRAMTEKYYFYHCDTVGGDVMSQYCRDLKGTLASFFNEHTDLGKSYVFDIQRTMSESYDRVRRTLYVESSSDSVCSSVESDSDVGCTSPARKVSRPARNRKDSSSMSDEQTDDSRAQLCSLCHSRCHCCQELNETLQRYQESFVCQMCFDGRIDTALVPCGHTICCAVCAARLDLCPLCKVEITQRLKLFLPVVQPTIDVSNGATVRSEAFPVSV